MRLLLILCCCNFWIPSCLMGQIPQERGFSKAHSGKFYYDVNESNHRRHKQYLYTVCPEEAQCLSLDFSLLHAEQEVDFIRVFDGENTDSPILGNLGGKSGNLLLQSNGGCITFEFLRDERSLNSVWVAQWTSDVEGDCIDPGQNPRDCQDLTEICGPRFHEEVLLPDTFWQRVGPPANLEAWGRAGLYKFRACKTGDLGFELIPDGGQADLDWALLDGSDLAPEACREKVLATARVLASNASSGRGPRAATGMHPKGSQLIAGADGSPYSAPVTVEKGQTLYLVVNMPIGGSGGFSLEMNEVVLTCGKAPRAWVQFAHSPPQIASKVLPRDQFSRYTQVLRIPLDTKMNQPLADCALPESAFQQGLSSKKTSQSLLPGSQGLVMALIHALRSGQVSAFAAEDLRKPIHFGDLLELAYQFAEIPPDWGQKPEPGFGPIQQNYWSPSADLFANYCNVVEVIQDEIFDRQRGQSRRQIRFIRLLWSDWEGDLPDRNVCVFPYDENLANLLDRIWVSSQHNDRHMGSLRDFLEGARYEGISLRLRDREMRSAQDGQEAAFRELEFQNYVWDR